MTTKYRIRWRHTVTGFTGQGEPVIDSPDLAQELVDRLNVASKQTQVVYEIEAVAVEEEHAETGVQP